MIAKEAILKFIKNTVQRATEDNNKDINFDNVNIDELDIISYNKDKSKSTYILTNKNKSIFFVVKHNIITINNVDNEEWFVHTYVANVASRYIENY